MAHLHLNELSLICDMWLNKITYLEKRLNFKSRSDKASSTDQKKDLRYIRALTLRSSNKVEVRIRSGWLKCPVSKYHSCLKTPPLCWTSTARTDHRYYHNFIADAVTRGCKVAANGEVCVR